MRYRLMPDMGALLRRNATFRRLWLAQTVSVFGDAVTLVALPTIAVLTLHAGAFTVGALTGVGWASWGLFGLVAGVWVDRLPWRGVLVIADVIRLLLLASVPVAWHFHVLSIAQLLAVAGLAGVASVFFGLASTSYMPHVVERRDLTEANSRLEVSTATASLAGPGLAGAVIGVVGAPLALVADACSFAVSASLIGRTRSGAVPRPERRRFRVELLEGIHELAARPAMVATATAAGISNFGLAMTQGVIFLFAYRGLHMHPVSVGAALTIGASGSLAGALLARPLTERLGTGLCLFGSTTFEGLAGLVLPLALLGTPVLWLGLGLGLRGLANPLWQVNAVTLRQSIVPVPLQARVAAASRTIGQLTLPLGALSGGALGGVAAHALGPAHGFAFTLTVAALVAGASGLAVAGTSFRALRVDPVCGLAAK